MDFHGRMMNISTPHEKIAEAAQAIICETDGLASAVQRAYRYGHRDARHAAAEIADEMDRMLADSRATFAEADQTIRELRAENVTLSVRIREMETER